MLNNEKENKERESLVNDLLNLKILEKICQGEGISFNISRLSQTLNKHRSTIKKRIDNLLKFNVINVPNCPFSYLYREYPLLVMVFADFPNRKEVVKPIAPIVKNCKENSILNIFQIFKIDLKIKFYVFF